MRTAGAVGMSSVREQPTREERLRRANLRLAAVLGLVAVAVYVGFVIHGML